MHSLLPCGTKPQYKKPITLISIKYISVFFFVSFIVLCLQSHFSFPYIHIQLFDDLAKTQRLNDIFCAWIFFTLHCFLYIWLFICHASVVKVFISHFIKCFRPICNWFWKWCQRFLVRKPIVSWKIASCHF